MRRTLLLVGFIVLLAGCDSSNRPDYYPTAIGNAWQYLVSDPDSSWGDDFDPVPDTLTVTVIASAQMTSANHQGQTVYQLEQAGPIPFWWLGDTIVLAKLPDTLVIYDNLEGFGEIIFALLPAEVGRNWVFRVTGADTVLGEIVRKETVTVPAGNFTDCIRIEYSSYRLTDEKYSVWFAAGVGPVQYEYTRGIDSGKPRSRFWELMNLSVTGE